MIAARVAGATRAPAGGLVRSEGDRLLLDCHGGALELTEVRPPGGRPMAAADWLRGRPDPTLVNFRLDPALPDRELSEVLERARAEWADPRRRVAAARVRARRPRHAGRARRDGRAERRPGARDARARRLRARPARDGRARAAGRAGRRAERDGRRARTTPRSCRRSRARSATSARRTARPGCSRSAPTRTPTSARPSRSRSAGAEGDDVLAALIELSADASSGVRDWATFALGTLAREDSEALRDALAARLDDPDEETRLEAVHGLAVRGDHRADDTARDLLAAHEHEDVDSVWTRHLLAETASHLEDA